MNSVSFHVAIDSNHLRKDRSFSKTDLLFLKSLAKMGLVTLHLPWFIYKECTSTYTNEIMIELEAITNDLKKIGRKGLNEIENLEIIKIASLIEDFKKKVPDSVQASWQCFITETNAILYKFDPEESVQVFENYFTGGKPFKSLKSRVDIPDAFIFSTINKISKSNFIHFITEDNNLREMLLSNVFVRTYKDFSELYQANMFEPVQKRYQEIEKYDFSKKILLGKLTELKEVFQEFLDEMKPVSFFDRHILSDNSHAILNSFSIDILDIEEIEIKYIDNSFYVPMIAKGSGDIDYFVFKYDYRNDSNKKAKISNWNDDYYLVEDVLPMIIKKVITVSINELRPDQKLEIKIDGLDEVIINNAAL